LRKKIFAAVAAAKVVRAPPLRRLAIARAPLARSLTQKFAHARNHCGTGIFAISPAGVRGNAMAVTRRAREPRSRIETHAHARGRVSSLSAFG